jgi:signal transduction histidine kinase/PAS domain-containing protein
MDRQRSGKVMKDGASSPSRPQLLAVPLDGRCRRPSPVPSVEALQRVIDDPERQLILIDRSAPGDLAREARKVAARANGRIGVAEAGPDASDAIGPLIELAVDLDDQVRESEARFRSIVGASADGVVVIDGNGRIRFVNPAAERLFGRPQDKLLGEDFGHPVVAGEMAQIEIFRRGGDGVVAEVRVVETVWEGDAVTLVTLRDITDRMEAEERARVLVREQTARAEADAAARRSRLVADVAGALDASLDVRDTAREAARLLVPEFAEWCVLTGASDGAARCLAAAHRDSTCAAILRQRCEKDLAAVAPPVSSHDENYSARSLSLIEVAETGADVELFAHLGTEASLILPLTASGTDVGALVLGRGGHRGGFDKAEISCAEDIARHLANAVRQSELYREVQDANRAKSAFLAVMSHELRTPLNAVTGFTHLLSSGVSGELNEKQLSHLERIESSSRHLLQLVEEILFFASLETGEGSVNLSQIDLAIVAKEAADALEPLAMERGVELVVNADPAIVQTDERKIRQVLLNLASNALKFTDEGTVCIRVESRPDGGAVLTVSDTGIGIPEKHHERIFEAFWQVEDAPTRTAGGTGLGLSVVKQVIDLLGGTIEVQSNEGRGSTFTVTLPPSAPGGLASESEDDSDGVADRIP